MEKSLFRQYVDKWFEPLILKIVALINGSENPIVYYHKRMLNRKYSPTMKWGSLSSNGRPIAADVVALNSPLPLKKRDAITQAEGDIPKLGMKLFLDEKTLQDLDLLDLQNRDGSMTNQIIKLLFADTRKCIVGIDEQLEGMFLQALSSGTTIITDENNTGTGIRLDFGIPDDNKFGVPAAWSGASALPLDHIETVLAEARSNGHTIRKIMMSRTTFNNFRKHAQVRELYAAGLGFAGANIPVPNQEQVNGVLNANYNITIEIVDRTVNYEKNGVTTTINPWTPNVAVFLTGDQVGSLVWSRLAEMNHRAKQVTYAVADEFKLISKYHKNDPLREFTSSQAIVVPVLDGVNEIYLLDTEAATMTLQAGQPDDEIETYEYNGSLFTKQSVVNGLNATNEVAATDVGQADSTIAKKISRLEGDAKEVFEKQLESAADKKKTSEDDDKKTTSKDNEDNKK